MQTLINNAIEQINQGTDWVINKAKKDKIASYKALVKERRTLKKIRNATANNTAVVLYGQSQCGKSHLASLLLSDDGKGMKVKDRMNLTTHDFLARLNPQGSGEATGIITRFTIQQQPNITKEFPVHIKLMSVKDITLMLCEGYYRDLEHRDPLQVDEIKRLIDELRSRKMTTKQNYICEDDIGDIEEYFQIFSQDLYYALDATDYFGELSLIIEYLSEEDIVRALCMFWNNDQNLSDTFKMLFVACKRLGFASDAYISFSDLYNSSKSLLDVNWLDLDDTNTKSTVYYKRVGNEFESVSIEKTYLAAICAEVILEVVPPEADNSEKGNYLRTIMQNVDILDFPGARPRGGIFSSSGHMDMILRRGKVGYYFNKYSSERRISSLLFCWEPNNFDSKPMENVLRNWVDIAIGRNEEERSVYMEGLNIPPLFFVGTKFNLHLKAKKDDEEGNTNALNTRWDKWFIEQLSKDIIAVPNDPSDNDNYKWFVSWTKSVVNFDNCYLLRDFSYSTDIFDGWTEETGEETSRRAEKYPGFYAQLRDSFINHSFVKKHFRDAAIRWDEASELNCDGSLTIARNLASIVEKIATAAAAKNKRDVVESINKVIKILDGHHFNPNTEIALKKALDSAARLQSSLDHAFGRDPYYFGRFMKALTITEYAVHEVFSDVFAGISTTDNVGDYAFIYLRAPGLKPKNKFADNLEILRRAYSFDNVENCRQYFEKDLKIKLEDLFASSEFGLVSPSQLLAKTLKCYWFDQWLGNVQKESLSNMLGEGTYKEMVDMLKSLFNTYEIERKVAQAIHNYVDTFGNNVQALSEMIADMCAEMINKFVLSVGYAYYSQKDEENNTGELKKDDVVKYLKDVNQQHNIGLSFRFVEEEKQQIDITHVAEMMAKMDDKSNIRQLLIEYSKVGIDQLPDQSVDELSAHIPGFRQSCRWRDLAKFGFVLTKDIPNYNIEDNDQLGRIIEKCKSLINN